jgi:hypothetical protein
MSIRLATSLGTVAGLALASVAVAGPAAAQEPAVVDLLGCEFFEGGETTVDEGLVDVLVTGWGTGSRGALNQWLKSQNTTFTVQYEGEEAVTEDVSDAWSPPTPFDTDSGRTAWGSDLFVSLGELEAGETLTISFETMLTKPIIDFFKGDPPIQPGHIPAGTTFSGTCEVTVV